MATHRGVLVLALVALAARTAGAIVTVTACEAIVPDHEVGVLAADLTCTADAPSVILANRATLDLNGHTLTHTSTEPTVRCEGSRCAVLSSVPGGTIVTAATAVRGNRVTVSDCAVDVTGSGGDVVNAFRVTAENLRITNATSAALMGLKISATNVELVDCWIGVFALTRFRGELVTVTGGGTGIIAPRRASVSGLTIHGTGYEGVRARGIRLVDSDVTGNGTLGSGVDLATERRPILVSSVCGVSRVLTDPPSTDTWGVCQND